MFERRFSSHLRVRVGSLVVCALLLVSIIAVAPGITPHFSYAPDWWNAWQYRRALTVSYAGDLTDYELLYNATDFKTLYDAGLLQDDCDDLRFTDDSGDSLAFFTEVCDTTTGGSSLVWILMDHTAPSTTLWMYYANPIATSGDEAWSGNLITMFTSAPAGWTQLSDMTNRFPRGSETYGGTGGSSTHTHTGSATVGDVGSNWNAAASGSTTVSAKTHTHSNPSVTVSSDTYLPPYCNLLFYYSTSFTYSYPTSTIVMMNGTIPTGWSAYGNLTSRFPYGATSSIGTTGGGGTSHTHTGDPADLGAGSGTVDTVDTSSYYAATATHTHTVGSATSSAASAESIPAYMTSIFMTPSDASPFQAGMVMMFSALPPFGWTRVAGFDSRYPYGAVSFGTQGAAVTHTHTATITSGQASLTVSNVPASGTGVSLAQSDHYHEISVSLAAASVSPPYLDVIFGQRQESLPSVSVGSAEYFATTYTTQTTSQTITSTSTTVTSETVTTSLTTTSTTLTSVTSTTTTSLTTSTTLTTETTETYTSTTTSLTVLTNMPQGGPAVVGAEEIGISASRWDGVVNQTQTVMATVTVTSKGTGTLSITDVQFSKDALGKSPSWVTLNETMTPACGCYAVLNTFSPAKLHVRISPGADVEPKVWSVGMLVIARTGSQFVVSDETSLIITVRSILGPVAAYPQPTAVVPQSLLYAAYGGSAIASAITIAIALRKRAFDFGVPRFPSLVR